MVWCAPRDFGGVNGDLTPSTVSKFYQTAYYTHGSAETPASRLPLLKRDYLAWHADRGTGYNSGSVDKCSESDPWFPDLTAWSFSRARRSLSGIWSAVLGPDVRLGVGVVAQEVIVDRLLQLGHAAQRAAPNTLIGDLGEEPLDQVQPGRGCRDETQLEAWILVAMS